MPKYLVTYNKTLITYPYQNWAYGGPLRSCDSFYTDYLKTDYNRPVKEVLTEEAVCDSENEVVDIQNNSDYTKVRVFELTPSRKNWKAIAKRVEVAKEKNRLKQLKQDTLNSLTDEQKRILELI